MPVIMAGSELNTGHTVLNDTIYSSFIQSASVQWDEHIVNNNNKI